MTVEYLSIDPGETCGICGYDENGGLRFMNLISLSNLTIFLKNYTDIRLCVVENYKVYPQKAKQHTYSDVPTIRAIGRIESWAELNEIKLVKQGAHIKATGYQFLGKKPLSKTDPRNHTGDAHAHFTYWAVSNGLIKAEDLLNAGS